MIKAAVSISAVPTLSAAVEMCASSVLQQLGTTPSLAIFFVTPHHAAHFPELGSWLKQRLRCELAGCTTTHVSTRDGENEAEPGFGVLAIAGDIDAKAFVAGDLQARAGEIGKELGESFAARPAANRLLCVFPDAYVGSLAPLVRPLVSAYGHFPLVGAAPSESGLGRTRQWGPDGIAHSGALSGFFLGGQFDVLSAVMQGCAPVGAKMEVTEAAGPVVMALDGRPALEVFAERLPQPLREQLPRAFRTVLFSTEEKGGFLARHIVGLEADRQGLVFAESIPEGSKVRLAIREAGTAREDIKKQLALLADQLHGRTPLFGLYFNCSGRGSQLYGVKDIDASYIDGALGPFPWLGMSSNAELATVAGEARLFAYTGVLTVVAAKE